MLDLVLAIQKRNSRALERAHYRLLHARFTEPDDQDAKVFRKMLTRGAGSVLADELGRPILEARVRLVLWAREEGEGLVIRPGLLCPDVTSALYTLVVLHLSGGSGLASCLQCGNLFTRQRKTGKYCLNKCRYQHFGCSPKKSGKKRK